jgi:tetratricopeptide (TPR) repeat protein
LARLGSPFGVGGGGWVWGGYYPYRFGAGYYPFGYYGNYGYGYTAYSGDDSYVATYQPPTEEAPQEPPSEEAQDVADQYYSAAYDAFRRGDYSAALRQASHAAVELPNHNEIHELISLSLFALGDYRAASMEAHAAAGLGPVSDWPRLYAHYGNIDTYRGQLDKLVKFQKENPNSPEAEFLLGYHNLMMGHKEIALKQLERALAKVPQDQVARKLVKDLGGNPPPAPGEEAAPAAGAAPAAEETPSADEAPPPSPDEAAPPAAEPPKVENAPSGATPRE